MAWLQAQSVVLFDPWLSSGWDQKDKFVGAFLALERKLSDEFAIPWSTVPNFSFWEISRYIFTSTALFVLALTKQSSFLLILLVILLKSIWTTCIDPCACGCVFPITWRTKNHVFRENKEVPLLQAKPSFFFLWCCNELVLPSLRFEDSFAKSLFYSFLSPIFSVVRFFITNTHVGLLQTF